MKKILFALFVVSLFTFQAFAQADSIKNYPLKDYVAPDIRYRLLNLGSALQLGGSDIKSETERSGNAFSTNVNLYYYEYENLTNYQGTTNASLNTSYNTQWGKTDSVKDSYTSPRVSLSSLSQSRFYNKNGTFWGIHGDIRYSFSARSDKNGEEKQNAQLHHLAITPYVSFGNGRIEPVESARTAMDILLALQKYNRLAQIPDKTMIDSLSRVANRITWKRFFDYRYKYIYQLEELDNALQNMDLVDTADIIYFANLNDIWAFARTYNRGSGVRYEGGIIPDLSFTSNEYKDSNPQNYERKFKNNNYGIFGFFSLRRMKPISYAWQSDIMLDLSFGYEGNTGKEEISTGDDKDWSSSYLKALLNTGWQFGFYPNTRTYAGITPYAAVSFVGEQGTSENTFGLSTGFWFNSYYYVSPRLRLAMDASFYYSDKFDYSIPSLFWDNFTEARVNRSFRGSNYELAKGFAYSFSFTLRYAIL
ncbi:MAG: hypothetical protein L3J66_13380 [Bacteroidales bacterium]|nr:hypothetical protein [Bacteroidales bacterium]